MKKPLQRYFVTVKYPRDSSSNISEVGWYDIYAVSEAQALHKARIRASSRIDALLNRNSSQPNPKPL
jgi:hypothetical protein